MTYIQISPRCASFIFALFLACMPIAEAEDEIFFCPPGINPPNHILIALDGVPATIAFRQFFRAAEVMGTVFLKNTGEEPDVFAVDHPSLAICWVVKNSAGDQVDAKSKFPPWGFKKQVVTKGLAGNKTITESFSIRLDAAKYCHGHTYKLYLSFWGFVVEHEFNAAIYDASGQPVTCE